MIRYTIINNTTAGEWRFTSADLDREGKTVEEWLESRAAAYGSRSDLTVNEVNDGPSVLAEAQDRLWREAWAWGDRQFAEQDRTTVLGWLAAGLLTPAGAAKWREVIAWHDAVFALHYAAAKAAITAAGAWVEPDWLAWPACPHTFYTFLVERAAP